MSNIWLFLLYVIMAVVIVVLSCVVLEKKEEIKEIQSDYDYTLEKVDVLIQEKNLYKQKYEENEKIIENIKEILPF